MVVTAPPTTVASTTTWSSTSLPVWVLSAWARRVLLVGRERNGGAHRGDGPAGVGGSLDDELVDDLGELTTTSRGDDHADEGAGGVTGAAAEKVVDDLAPRRRREQMI